MLFDLIAVVRRQVCAFFDVADAFEPVLADLVAHQRGELVAVVANRVRHLVDVREAILPRPRGPGGIRRTRRVDGRLHVLARAFLEVTDDDAGVDRAAIVESLVGLQVFAVDVEKVLAAERAGDLCDRLVELAVQILE